eukprot:scaffold94452_cov75-Phaeocystis_antarctica.AAC.3
MKESSRRIQVEHDRPRQGLVLEVAEPQLAFVLGVTCDAMAFQIFPYFPHLGRLVRRRRRGRRCRARACGRSPRRSRRWRWPPPPRSKRGRSSAQAGSPHSRGRTFRPRPCPTRIPRAAPPPAPRCGSNVVAKHYKCKGNVLAYARTCVPVVVTARDLSQSPPSEDQVAHVHGLRLESTADVDAHVIDVGATAVRPTKPQPAVAPVPTRVQPLPRHHQAVHAAAAHEPRGTAHKGVDALGQRLVGDIAVA